MEWLHDLLDNGTTPVLTAFLLGLLTAVSPCPLAANITAIGFIGKNIGSRRQLFAKGVLYTLGRIAAYTVLGIVLICILRQGASVLGIRKAIAAWSEVLFGPLLLLIGLFMLFGSRLKLAQGSPGARSEAFAGKGGWGAFLLGALFALSFCPTSGVFYFGMLVPMAATTDHGWLLPAVFAAATALPVLAVAWILAFGIRHLGAFYGRMKTLQTRLNTIVGVLFLAVGIYYCIALAA
ncbi:aromatic aminobenezylarsenical efflux permease ArsG family transporter [uncultured Alistipes sp.]|uniref:aromatic aminobenezylarsenical efflux permease ArsG family transporter n=1 Tax=uncultured Alistipes sp. TaxID=538949 RepID=UPI00266F352F|nr:aromatic aminobenezylarsenical efflux permease ArsG family transporter [uncultured Alistipes sp.]